jgi:membrane protease YdiL (CAAX protease family)
MYFFFPMSADEVGIIGGASTEHPQPSGLGRFLLEESAWLLAAFAVTILTATSIQTWGGRLAPAAPGVALFGLHGLVGIHVLRTEADKLAGWFKFDRRAVLWGVGGGLFLLAFNGLYSLALESLGVVPPDVAAKLRELLPEPVLIFWAALLAPIVEELYFRGRLLDGFAGKLGATWAGMISSVAFAAIHGIPAFVPAYLVFAFTFIALRRRTGGLTAAIIAHVMNNAFALMA